MTSIDGRFIKVIKALRVKISSKSDIYLIIKSTGHLSKL